PASLPAGVMSSFNAIYDDMVANYLASSSSSPRKIISIEFVLTNSTTAKVNLRYYSTASQPNLIADAQFDYTYVDGVLTLFNYKPAISNTNWNTRLPQMIDFVDWLQSGPFKVDW